MAVEQATVATFSRESHAGSVLLDNGDELPFDGDAFADSGLRFLRPGQRVTIRMIGGRLDALTLSTFPLR
jgi:cold shock CspA family protein